MGGGEIFPGWEGLTTGGQDSTDYAGVGLPTPQTVIGNAMGVFWPGFVTIVGILVGFKVLQMLYGAFGGRK